VTLQIILIFTPYSKTLIHSPYIFLLLVNLLLVHLLTTVVGYGRGIGYKEIVLTYMIPSILHGVLVGAGSLWPITFPSAQKAFEI
jgi:hypothetical protein